MTVYSFAEHIGKPIYIATRSPFAIKEGSPFWISGLLLGSEPSGVWIKPNQGHFHEEILWKFELELEEEGLAEVGSLELGFFVPFSEIRFVQIVWPRMGI